MIRFTWMQFRIQALVALCGLAIVAVVLGLTGPSLVHLYDTSKFATCGAHGDCSTITNGLLSHDRLLQDLSSVLLAVPALIGLFWGAPLVARGIRDWNLPPCVGPGRHAHPLDSHQAGHRRPGQHGSRRTVEPLGDVVVEPSRPREPEPVFNAFR